MSSVCRRNGLREMTAQGHWASEGWDSNSCLCLFCDPPGEGAGSVASGATSVCPSLSCIPGHHAEDVLLLLRYDKASRSGDNFH